MRRFSALAMISALLLGMTLAVMPRAADAHETRAIGNGKYQIVVGFMNEPVYAGDKSGLEFSVSDISKATPPAGQSDEEGAGTPVEGLDKTLKAEVIFQDQTMELPLTAKWNQPGGYDSVFFPTKPGDYSFRIYGKIGETDIDETFTSGPETFGPVEDPAPLQFPKG
ncbi:MAG: hypothetical protein IT338_16460 [Thermomicrobiales bacterium]|nr:hypothetical protein [Thermomicrobiales bacterium]